MVDNVKVTEFVKRPGLGRIGRSISIRENFFEITSLIDSNIHHYYIIINLQVPPESFFQFMVLHGDVKPVFDGRQNIFDARQLPFGDTATYNICLSEDAGFSSPLRPLRLFKVIIRKVAQLVDHFYTNQISQACFGGLEVWQGFRQSIRPTPGRMMINVDVSATAFYESSDLVHMVAKILERNIDDLKGGIHNRDRLKLKKALKYLKIRVTHRDNGIRYSYKILKLTNTSTSNTQLNFGDERIDIVSYFQNTYNKPLQFPSLPYMEQHFIRKLNERQTVDMTKFSCQPPHICADKIKQGLDILDYRQNEYMKQFGLVVSEEMTVVPARILPTPKIRFHPFSRDASFFPRDGSWNLRDEKVATEVTLGSWSCVIFGNFAMQAVQHLSENWLTYILRKAWVKSTSVHLCILPNISVPLYAEIKRVGNTVIGVTTQYVQLNIFFKQKDNIALIYVLK
ncbi:2336_t:CDS:2 [Funneliformis caledonium]|uniref:2336_t:CDS:1 n=1 Tax=Funneliformis caledonium TaxID=1117310 RepID=A0A9N8Z227_9GLOM|nr:2336_t:CDS:2 [Funneliformis caledonium]